MAPTATSNIPPKRVLPSKESTLFKDLLQLYEARQLKKSLKTADQILKKFPEHGETLCMKGLVQTHLGKREEGLELVKKGIRFDLTSHICWHVFGLIQKGEKDYEGAYKSYALALKYDRENLNLLQDAANLQTQLRLYDNLQETRETLLKLRPNVRRNWIALAVAYHLNGHLSYARKVLEGYERTVKDVPDYDSEHSEVMVYYVRLLEEMGAYREALAKLDALAKDRVIVDRVAIMETRARLSSKLNEKDEAEQTWRSLIWKNAECQEYYRGFFSLRDVNLDAVSDEQRAATVQALEEFAEQLPRATAPRRLMLAVTQGDEFKIHARRYLTNGITKGLPSLFSDVKTLYADPSKRDILDELITSLETQYKPSDGAPKIDSESPTTYLWTLYYLAQHHSHLHRFDAALSVLETAMQHTPTLPELYTCKARTLKRAGNPLGAVKCLEEARRLDGQDRFLNTKSAKYCLRAGMVDEASDIFGLFTKKDAESPGADLEDMQSMLYLIEAGDAYKRLGKLGPALKKYLAVQRVFVDIVKDQFDFHAYSLRRYNIMIYFNLLEWADGLQSHPAFVKSAIEAAQIYIRAHDNPALTVPPSTRTDAEKKAQKKAKKAAAKNQEENKKAAANPNASQNEDKGLEPPAEKDDDPEGYKALATKEPLEHAWKYLKPMAVKGCRCSDVWIAVYDVAVRRQKYVQASKALLECVDIKPPHPDLHVRTIDLKQRISSLPSPLPSPVASVVSTVLSKLIPGGLQPETFNSQYLQRNSANARAVLAAAKASALLKTPLSEVEDALFGVLGQGCDVDVATAETAIEFLASINSSRTDEFRSACDKRFPLSTVFKSAEEHARLREEIKKHGKEELEDIGKPETVS